MRSSSSSATPRTPRSGGASCSRPDPRQLQGRRSGVLPGDLGQLRPLGRHRHPPQGADDHLRRPWLRRHRPHEAAGDPPEARRRARRRPPLRLRGPRRLRSPGLGLGDADLVVAADGVNSAVRAAARGGLPARVDVGDRPSSSGSARRGASTPSPSSSSRTSTASSRPTPTASATTHSAFIVECDEASWRNAGFDRMDIDATIAACEAIFAPWLDGHRLLANIPPISAPRPGSTSPASTASAGGGGISC